MRVFISGPMREKPNYNREAFYKAQEELEKYGYSVWNPAWLPYPDAIPVINDKALRLCDAIYMLKGWMQSEGACNEHQIALARGLIIMYEGTYCWCKDNVDKETRIDNLENTNEVHWIEIQKLDKKLDELIHNVAELEKDQCDINSKVTKRLDDNKEAHMHLNNADDALERRIEFLEKKCKGIGSIVKKTL